MQPQTFLEIFERDLLKLKEEISLYKNENDLWKVNGDGSTTSAALSTSSLTTSIKNSAGNLALHCIGALKHFIGAILGNTGYVRERDKEFSTQNISAEKIISDIDEVISILKKVLSTMKNENLMKDYPIEFLGQKRTVFFVLLQSAVHLNYHLGQINYHRRLCC